MCTTTSTVEIFARDSDEMADGMDLGDDLDADAKTENGEVAVVKKDEEATERWRMNPVFMRGEVTMTSLGVWFADFGVLNVL